MRVNTTCSFLPENSIKKIESKYNAKYVLETCLKDKHGGWANFPAAVFYTPEKHPRGSNYFALYFDELKQAWITDALPSIQEVLFEGIKDDDEVVYSRYRHDFRYAKNGGFVDGGRDYFRRGGNVDLSPIKFKVVEDHLEIIS